MNELYDGDTEKVYISKDLENKINKTDIINQLLDIDNCLQFNNLQFNVFLENDEVLKGTFVGYSESRDTQKLELNLNVNYFLKLLSNNIKSVTVICNDEKIPLMSGVVRKKCIKKIDNTTLSLKLLY